MKHRRPKPEAALEAYSAGDQRASRRRSTPKPWAAVRPEMWLFNAPMAPWRACGFTSRSPSSWACQMSGHLEAEVLRRAQLVFGVERIADRSVATSCPKRRAAGSPPCLNMPPFSPRSPAATPPHAPMESAPAVTLQTAWPFAGRFQRLGRRALRALPQGARLLANDPHLGFTAPAIWYLARLELAIRRRDRWHHPGDARRGAYRPQRRSGPGG